jgi:GAF domain-containing protein
MTSDKDRLRALAEYEVLDSLPEKEFDDIVELASAICGTPISAISLLDLDRQWFKSQIGLDVSETPIEQSFCRYAVNDPDGVMVISDSTKDDRFKNNPLTLGDPNIRFYAGAPLITSDGVPLGALCVIDSKPRQFNDQEKRMLQVLAKRVMRLLDLRKENLHQRKHISATEDQLAVTLDRLIEAQNIAKVGNWEWNMVTGSVYWSPQIYALMSTEEKPATVVDSHAWERLIHPEDLATVQHTVDILLHDHKPTVAEYRIISEGKEVWVLGKSYVSIDSNQKVERVYGTVQDITDIKSAEKQHAQYIAMLEKMLFDVSHMIRKPLTTLMGLIPILKDTSTSQEDFRQAADYFYESLNELEGYTRSLNEELYKSKMDLTGSK